MKYLTYFLIPGFTCLILGAYFKNMPTFMIGEYCTIIGGIGAIFLSAYLREKKLDYEFHQMLKKRFQK